MYGTAAIRTLSVGASVYDTAVKILMEVRQKSLFSVTSGDLYNGKIMSFQCLKHI
jgi:hypothetical protein